ncbi:hypothetical protein NDU88_003138 [Pleurodeles waltl]|uniref:Uncharacterized protein n=1 Tax=Pleurodeles waltl TaxID=8319 RepID=A0AAV7PC45_PLEWA|nr:hypothetical protein NDU88_003138 [Pleurodeles waltl]
MGAPRVTAPAAGRGAPAGAPGVRASTRSYHSPTLARSGEARGSRLAFEIRIASSFWKMVNRAPVYLENGQ